MIIIITIMIIILIIIIIIDIIKFNISVDKPSCCEKMCVLVSDPGDLKDMLHLYLRLWVSLSFLSLSLPPCVFVSDWLYVVFQLIFCPNIFDTLLFANS